MVAASFWRRDDVQVAVARRDVGQLFKLYLEAFPGCTQTQLALLTQHDRSDVSNWIRGTRHGRVSDIEVLARIADGLQMPDETRVLLGLAPADVRVTRIGNVIDFAPSRSPLIRPPSRPSTAIPIAICGSRADGTNTPIIDSAIRALARLVMTHKYRVIHGPIGVGIEVMTYLADHYRPPDMTAAVGVFGRHNVVRDAHYVIVIGGGAGTQDEVDIALSMAKRIIVFPASGGTALRFHDEARMNRRLCDWMPEQHFTGLDKLVDLHPLGAADADRAGMAFASIVEELVTNGQGGHNRV